jgi:prepilin-type N-terminal cleavage/methylation domain-containing protein
MSIMTFKINSKKGFTLVEVMTVVAVSSILFAIISGLFSFAIKNQREILNRQRTMNQISYVADRIAMELRDAKIPPDGFCVPSGVSYSMRDQEPGNLGGNIVFYSRENKCLWIFLDETKKQIFLQEMTVFPHPEPVPLSSGNLEIRNFRISLLNPNTDGSTDGQARISFLIEVLEPSKVIITKTVSQRNLNIINP